MPPKVKYNREAILNAALGLVRTEGIGAVNARAIAKVLGCSTQPLFREFQSMEQIKKELLMKAVEEYDAYIAHSAGLADSPYKGTGMAYLRYAKDDPELFKLLFMRDRVAEGTQDTSDDANMTYILNLIMQRTGYTPERALRFHQHLWIFVHGLASMIATRYLAFDEGRLSELLTDEFEATKRLYDQQR
ncbi:MAG: TetR/AcrR family transcriptional regulator [Clostridia bacterium]